MNWLWLPLPPRLRFPLVTKVAGQPGVDAVSAVTAQGGTAGQVAQTGFASVTDGAVTITDKNATSATVANTIASVSLNNYGAAVIADNALATLTLAGTGGGVTITTHAGFVNPVTTLTVNANGIADATNTGAIVDTNNEITTLNVVTGGTTGSSFSGTVNISDTGLTTLNVSGTESLTLSAVPASLTTLTVTGSAGFSGNISATGITTFAPTSTGKIAVTINDTTQVFTGGAGTDVVTIAGDATKAVTGRFGCQQRDRPDLGFDRLYCGQDWHQRHQVRDRGYRQHDRGDHQLV